MEEATTWSKLVEESKRTITSSALSVSQMSVHVASLQAELKEARQQSAKLKQDIDGEKQKKHKFSEELAVANSKLKRLGTLNKSGSIGADTFQEQSLTRLKVRSLLAL